jgi:hypothetical protein
MSYTNGLDKPTDYFNTKLWTGTGSSNALTGVGFQPDWVWIKNRTVVNSHVLQDAVRGVGNTISTNNTNAESSEGAGDLTAFGSDGFTVGTNTRINGSGNSMVAWNWLGANGTASNTDGSITSTVSANTTSGFSIVSYDGDGSAGATVGHGLGAVPKVMILKRLENADSWSVYHSSVGATKRLRLNTADATQTSSSFFNDTEPTSSLFTLGVNSEVNGSAEGYICYCFAEKKGYSKFSSYIGNGNSDGTFIYTGFKPAWVIIKATSQSGEGWFMFDNKRDVDNAVDKHLTANLSNTEASGSHGIDFVSNGIKIKNSGDGTNTSGGTYVYMAFAENPFVTSTGIPTTAR